MPKRTGMTVSVTDEERDRLNRLMELEGRTRRAQIMYLVDRRLAEIEREQEGKDA